MTSTPATAGNVACGVAIASGPSAKGTLPKAATGLAAAGPVVAASTGSAAGGGPGVAIGAAGITSVVAVLLSSGGGACPAERLVAAGAAGSTAAELDRLDETGCTVPADRLEEYEEAVCADGAFGLPSWSVTLTLLAGTALLDVTTEVKDSDAEYVAPWLALDGLLGPDVLIVALAEEELLFEEAPLFWAEDEPASPGFEDEPASGGAGGPLPRPRSV
jgi:hypothetical protein